MKLCDKHADKLTGEGDCFLCEQDKMSEIIFRQQLDKNLGNAVITGHKTEIQRLKDQLQALKDETANSDRFYQHYQNMTNLIVEVPDDDLKNKLDFELQWMKSCFDLHRAIED